MSPCPQLLDDRSSEAVSSQGQNLRRGPDPGHPWRKLAWEYWVGAEALRAVSWNDVAYLRAASTHRYDLG